MRVLHVIHQYLPNAIGGTEVVTHGLARGLQARGHAAAVFVPRPGGAPGLTHDTYDGVPLYRAGASWRDIVGRARASFGDAPVERAFAWALDDFRPDVVHFQHLAGLPLALVRQTQAAGIARVFTLHDYWAVCANAQLLTNYDQTVCAGPKLWLNCARCAAARVRQPLALLGAPVLAPLFGIHSRNVRQALDCMDALVAPTAFVRDLAAAHGLPVAKMRVIEHGVEIAPVRRRAQDVRRPLRFVYLGALAWQKGVHVIVAAARDLDAARATLTIYGDPLAFPEYVERLKDEAGPAVHFAGRLERHEVAAALVEGDVLLVPSLWYETSALVIQEAMACGLPVVASALGALPERIRPGVDGLLLPPGDVVAWRETMIDLAARPERIAALRQGIGPPRTLAEQVSDMEALYYAVVGEHEVYERSR
jgi:glycosyltransferase involved in cell wall biosynthesis